MKICCVEGCDSARVGNGLCSKHWQESKRRARGIKPKGGKCSVDGCSEPIHAKGACNNHYQILRRSGNPVGYQRARNGSGAERNGYRIVSKAGKQILEHRLVMAKILGRNLLHSESVHHKNGVRNDNRPENLELWSRCQPSGQRVADKLAWAREFIACYG
jgi:hypothetical protein